VSIKGVNRVNRQAVIAVLEEILRTQRKVAEGGGDVQYVIRVVEDKLNALDGGVR
jgi:hypothetical protein